MPLAHPFSPLPPFSPPPLPCPPLPSRLPPLSLCAHIDWLAGRAHCPLVAVVVCVLWTCLSNHRQCQPTDADTRQTQRDGTVCAACCCDVRFTACAFHSSLDLDDTPSHLIFSQCGRLLCYSCRLFFVRLGLGWIGSLTHMHVSVCRFKCVWSRADAWRGACVCGSGSGSS
uniref:Uncharacterized protein n=1 Tax=Vitrella brassicaformis TaxID=1169539 RepID=A0A7S1KCX4_9ALVE